MGPITFHATTKLENKLSGIYEILDIKKNLIAEKINRYTKAEKENGIQLALFLHLTFNLSVIAGLFYFFY